jgi:hypothetical protein
MPTESERRGSRRFSMKLPLTVRLPAGEVVAEESAETRDVSFRGLYFTADAGLEPGTSIEFVLTLPREITMAGEVRIRCMGEVLRVEPLGERRGVAARIDRYEILPV